MNQSRTGILFLVSKVGSDFKVVHLVSSVGDGEFANTVAAAFRGWVQSEGLLGSSGFLKLEIFKVHF